MNIFVINSMAIRKHMAIKLVVFFVRLCIHFPLLVAVFLIPVICLSSISLAAAQESEDNNSNDADLEIISSRESKQDNKVDWQIWSDDTFTKAEKDKKPVLLFVVANWSEESNFARHVIFSDSKLINLINEMYIPILVEISDHPLVGQVFAESGVPRLSVLNPDKRLISSLDGFLSLSKVYVFLRSYSEGITPKLSDVVINLHQDDISLPIYKKTRLIDSLLSHVDWDNGGYKGDYKFVSEPMFRFFLEEQDTNDKYSNFLNKTLVANFGLFDPIWGGVFRVSQYGSWNKPSFEKLSDEQAKQIILYSFAFAKYTNSKFKAAAISILAYLDKFMLSPEGTYYVSHSGFVLMNGETAKNYFSYDDENRRDLGLPLVETTIRTNVNAHIAEAMLILANVSDNLDIANKAKKLIMWCLDNMRVEGGQGFRHTKESNALFLIDNMNMASALLALYETEQEPSWLEEASHVLDYISDTFFEFEENDGKRISLNGAVIQFGEKAIQRDLKRSVSENCKLVYLAMRVYYYTMNPKYKALAKKALSFLASLPPVLFDKYADSIIIAYKYFYDNPLQLAVVGSKTKPQTQNLLRRSLSYPHFLKRVDLFDFSELDNSGSLNDNAFNLSSRSNLIFPPVISPSIFACFGSRCTKPVYKYEDLNKALNNVNRNLYSSR